MIKTRKDLKFYLTEDAKRNNCLGFFRYRALLLMGAECAWAFRYIKCMRKCEYHLNNSHNSLWHKAWYYFYKIRQSRLGRKYGIKISTNVCGYGLRILHLSGGGGVRISVIKCGNYCGFNAGVLIGNIDNADNKKVWQTIEKCPSGALGCLYRHGIDIVMDTDNCRSVAYDSNNKVGECDYQETEGGWNIYHTEVSSDYEGQGIAKRLVYSILEAAERKSVAITSTCSYASKVIGE